MSIEITSNKLEVAPVTAEAAAESGVEETKVSASAEEVDETVSQETEEDSETSETEGGEEVEAKEDKPKKKSGFQRRVDKLTSKLTAKDQEIEYLKSELYKKRDTEKPVQTLDAKPDGRPKKEDYDTHEAWQDADTDWKVDQKLSKKEAADKQAQLKSAEQKQVETYLARRKEFASKHDDFDELMESIDDIPMSLTVQEAILDSEDGPALQYALAKNREEYARICKLPVVAAARAIGKFEERLAKPSEATEIKTSKAPKPVKSVGSSGGSVVKKTIFNADSQAEYEALRREQRKKLA